MAPNQSRPLGSPQASLSRLCGRSRSRVSSDSICPVSGANRPSMPCMPMTKSPSQQGRMKLTLLGAGQVRCAPVAGWKRCMHCLSMSTNQRASSRADQHGPSPDSAPIGQVHCTSCTLSPCTPGTNEAHCTLSHDFSRNAKRIEGRSDTKSRGARINISLHVSC